MSRWLFLFMIINFGSMFVQELIIRLIVFIPAMILILVKPIQQDQTYHSFACDGSHFRCGCYKINNWQNVLSNIPFLVGSIFGLWLLFFKDLDFLSEWEHNVWCIIYLSFALVGFGSAYYHWRPTDDRLAWDRAPMTIGFMSFVSLTIHERMSIPMGQNIGSTILFPSIIIGILATVYGHCFNDLRAYAIVSVFFPMIVTPLIIYMFDTKYTHNQLMLYVCFWYLLAKFCEAYDHQIWNMTSKWISGHTLKHIFAGIIPFQLGYMLQVRHIIN
jgi:hypothetical protein